MTRALAVTTLLAACDANTSVNHPAPTESSQGQASAAEVAEVQSTIDRMTAAFHRGDLDAVMSAYTTPATVVFEPGQPAATPEHVRAGFEQFVHMKPSFEYSGHEVYIVGDLAVHHAPWTMTATGPDGTPLQQQGLSTAVLQRDADGQWLMAIDNPNSQHLLDTLGYPGDGELPPAATASQDTRAVLETIDRMTSAFADGDVEQVLTTYTPAATVLFNPGEPVRGSENLRATFERMALSKPAFRFSGHEVYIAGDVAVHTSPWTMAATAEDGTAIEDQGLSVAVLERQPDGGWLMAIDNPHGQRMLDEVGYP